MLLYSCFLAWLCSILKEAIPKAAASALSSPSFQISNIRFSLCLSSKILRISDRRTWVASCHIKAGHFTSHHIVVISWVSNWL